ncbi:MAG TPA: restriction endonuclease subunit S, partial [Pyrinomonadaceae bacterium]|nr:restriction endonuclease subunit S [Pyrinomonadaceae bacterium]
AEAIKNNQIDFNQRRGFISQELHELYCRKCKPQRGDIFVIKSGATTGNVAYVDVDFEFSIWSPLALIRCNQRLAFFKYVYYVLLSDVFRKQVELSWSFGTQQNIGMGVIECLKVPLPPLPEQQRIAAYLDASCTAIDTAVAAKRRQLETLDELCSSLLLRAITMGLHERSETQPTGAVVLPQIPIGWRLGRLKSVASIRYGLGQPPAELATGVAMIRATDVDAGKIRTDKLLRVAPEDLPPDRNPYLKANEIIVVRSGAYTGDSAIVPAELEGAVAGYDMVVTVTRASPRFVAYCLLSRYVLEGQLLLLTLRAAQPHLNAEELGSVLLALPTTRKEQEAIVDFLDTKLAEVRRIALGIETQIATLTAYRKSLIHEFVTGERRITETDVQRAAAQRGFDNPCPKG